MLFFIFLDKNVTFPRYVKKSMLTHLFLLNFDFPRYQSILIQIFANVLF